MYQLIKTFRFLYLFVMIVGFCFFKALDPHWGPLELADLFFLILAITSLLVISNKEKWVLAALVLMIIIEIALSALGFVIGNQTLVVIKNFVGAFFFLFMAGYCIYFTMQDSSISISTMFGALSAYLFIGLFFAYLFLAMQLFEAQHFSGLPAHQYSSVIYFSFVVMTTLGLGDILPLTPIAQTLVWFESYAGQCYLAIIIGQLVGGYVAGKVATK